MRLCVRVFACVCVLVLEFSVERAMAEIVMQERST